MNSNNAIHIHAAYTESNGLHSCCSEEDNPDSNGCLTVGTAGKAEYNNFIKAVYNTDITAIESYKPKSFDTAPYSGDLGCVIIDRTGYLEGLKTIYGDDKDAGGIAGENKVATGEYIASEITKNSIECRKKFAGSDNTVNTWYDYHNNCINESKDTPAAATIAISLTYKQTDATSETLKVDTVTVSEGGTASFEVTDMIPTRDDGTSRWGYKFSGWALTAGAKKATYTAGDELKAEASVTLYGVWKEKTFFEYLFGV